MSATLFRQQGRPSIKFQNREDLVVLEELIEAGQGSPVIGGTYPLSEIRKSIGHVGDGHARGTVVINVRPPSADAAAPADFVAPANTMTLASRAE